ncbi:MAG: PHP domain-containing protein [Mailhella sp.]|nr:PHP domain-containing protein [Mailhella sp.]
MDFIDLHTHSIASDGTFTPSAVARSASEAGLKAFALTDHDTVSGLDEAAHEAEAVGIECIRGIELSTSTEDLKPVHILGYWVPEGCDDEYFRVFRHTREVRNARMIERLNGLGIAVTMDDVAFESEGKALGRPHIAKALCRKGVVRSIKEAFAQYIGSGGAAYVPREPLPPSKAVSMLKKLGCTVSLAHPMLIGCNERKTEEIARSLIPFGLDAVEVYHSSQSPWDERFLTGMAKKLGLLATGGSDFHGGNKPEVSVGRGKGGLRIGYFVLDDLRKSRVLNRLPV